MTNPSHGFDSESITTAIESAMAQLQKTDVNSEEYAKIVANVAKLNKIRLEISEDSREWDVKQQNLELERATQAQRAELELASQIHEQERAAAPKRVSPDTVATVAANLIGIVLILRYERFEIIGSKAIGFVKSMR